MPERSLPEALPCKVRSVEMSYWECWVPIEKPAYPSATGRICPSTDRYGSSKVIYTEIQDVVFWHLWTRSANGSAIAPPHRLGRAANTPARSPQHATLRAALA